MLSDTVYARDILYTCNYSTDNSSVNATVLCHIYNNYSHQCYEEVGGQATTNSDDEKISNWGYAIGMDFSAREWVEQNNQCLPYLVVRTDNVWGGYGLHGFSTLDDALEYISSRSDFDESNYVATLEGLNEDDENNVVTHTCEYKENYSVTYEEGALYGQTHSSNSMFDGNSIELVSGTCPNATYYDCIGNTSKCNILSQRLDGFQGNFANNPLCSIDGVSTGYCDNNGSNNSSNSNNLCEGDDCNISFADMCMNPNVSNTLRAIGIIIIIIKVLVPAVIIIVGIKNLFMIITSGKEEDVKKYAKAIVLRIIVGVLIFLLPGIITFIYDAAKNVIASGDSSNFDNCWNCLFNIDECDH